MQCINNKMNEGVNNLSIRPCLMKCIIKNNAYSFTQFLIMTANKCGLQCGEEQTTQVNIEQEAPILRRGQHRK